MEVKVEDAWAEDRFGDGKEGMTVVRIGKDSWAMTNFKDSHVVCLGAPTTIS